MKKLRLFLAVLALASTHQLVRAQVNVNINIGNQPVWGPTGYDYAQYYYLPDLDIYYNVPQQQWVYAQNNRWITAATLPPQYRNYDLYSLHKVVINEQQPYLRDNVYRAKYASFKGRHDQQPIRDSHDSKYFVIANHPQHNQYSGQQANNRGRGPQPNQNNRDANNRGGQRDRGNQGDHEKGHDRN